MPVAGDVAVGSKLGPYELVRKLGQGGMGAVYEARHSKLGKTFALKVLPGGFASNRGALTRFEREMQAIGKLDHPHIIKATDADEWQGTHYLVMEYVEGTDLSELVKARGPLSVRDGCKAIRQAAMGLEHAHQHGLVHRDIKPSNLFVTKSGQIKLLDLGLARLGDDGEHQRGLTTVGQVLGTPDYMAPEQWDDTHSVDARADLYSLGCTLFFVLTGRAPYADVTKSSLLQLMKAHVEGAIPNLTDIRLDVPAELNAIFARLLAKNADDRYATAGEVIAALEPFTRKGSDTEVFAGNPVFVPGKEPPAVRAVESTSEASIVRDGSLSAQRSIKSLSASSTDDAFGSNRPMIQSDRSASMVETIIQSRPQQPSRGRGPLVIGISLVSLAVLIGLAIQFTSKPATNSATGETSTAGQSSTVSKNENQTPTGWHGWPADAPRPAIAPFDADQAKKHQEEWAAYLKVPVEWENAIGIKFRLIPPGEFLMGSTPDEIDDHLQGINRADKHWQYVKSEGPQHRVVLTQAMYLSKTEVTQIEYESIMGKNPSFFSPDGEDPVSAERVAGLVTSYHPVEGVAWDEAVEFCVKLGQRDQISPPEPPQGKNGGAPRMNYRLPTEAEWEYAGRAGTVASFGLGNNQTDLEAVGWFEGNSGYRTHTVGELKPNPFGLYDIHGNVWEWVSDIWEPTYYSSSKGEPAVNPENQSHDGNLRLGRGGYWGSGASNCRVSNRDCNLRQARFNGVGLRIGINAKDVKALIEQQSATSVTSESWHGWPADAPKPAIAPFDAEQAKKHQEEWAAYLKVPVEYTNSIGMKFRLIPPGEFLMGMSQEEVEAIPAQHPNSEHWKFWALSSAPAHRVRLTQPYYVGTYEVTQEEYEKVVGRNPSHFSLTGKGKEQIKDKDTQQHPVESVSFIDAVEFCIKLSNQEILTQVYGIANNVITRLSGAGYRLATEAEWEWACRTGTATSWSHGEQEISLGTMAWYSATSGSRTHAVGELKANPFGLYDMHGNVWEWCQDWHDVQLYAQRSDRPTVDPQGPETGSTRVLRGGSSFSFAFLCRSAFRFARDVGVRDGGFGFRVVLGVDAVRQAAKVTESAMPKSVVSNAKPAPAGWHGWPADAPKPAIAPFDADQAKKHQEEWAAYLKVPVEFTNSIGMKFRLIPPGEFIMGSTPAEIEEALKFVGDDNHWKSCLQSEAPDHKVILTRPIYLGVHEVTQDAYEKVMERNPSHFAAMGTGKDAVAGVDTRHHPVEMVSWDDAAEFCTQLSTREKLRPFYLPAGETVTKPEGTGYRLPTEAEWEFACRAGTTTRFWIGNSDQALVGGGWFSANSRGRTHAVGELKVNPLGIYDTHGNVFEWVNDWWEPAYYSQFEKQPAQNPEGATASAFHRTVRGGGWDHPATRCRSALRLASDPPYREHNLGFRVALTLDAVNTKTTEGE